MGFWEVAYLAWPWAGLGAAVVVLVLLFATGWLRSDTSCSRWKDPTWLSWLPVPVYMLHVFEEYGMHVTDGQFDLVTSFREMGVDAMFGGIPLVVFPEVNILLIYVTFPIAALLARKRPVIGLMPYGFMLVNGLTHIAGTVRFGGGLLSTPGNVTGLFLFIPLFVWFCVACRRYGVLSGKGMAAAIVAGVVQHIGIFSCYFVNLLAGNAAALAWVPFMCTWGILVAWGLGRALKAER